MLKTEIPYPESAENARLFAPLAEQRWSVWLDSGSDGEAAGRYDIIVADPVQTLVTRGTTTEIVSDTTRCNSDDDPLELLRGVLSAYRPAPVDDLPFAGGAVGYFSYDLARRFEKLPVIAENDLAMPEMVVAIYEWALVCDRLLQRCWLVSALHDDEPAYWPQLVARFTEAAAQPLDGATMVASERPHSNLSTTEYADAFKRIHSYLEEGDCYQVNFAQRFSLAVQGRAWDGYRQLRQRSGGPFSAYLNTPEGEVLCTSPERFLQLHGDEVETRPIKGTRRRDSDAAVDAALKRELADSDKDRAENLMIVDLLRNDLGKSCATGSVSVPQLFAVESFSTVHHLVSSVICRLRAGEDALSLLRGCFPGGSITGAPKLRAMEIIEELEPHRRGIYCGSIGYIGFDGNMDSNIVIRTAIHRDGRLYYSAGGGIVRDSVCEEEYQESFDKARAFLDCFTHG